MSKNQVTVQDYIAPATRVIPMQQPCSLLAGSPNGNGGGTSVVPLDPDDDDDISGAKKWGGSLWEEEEEDE